MGPVAVLAQVRLRRNAGGAGDLIPDGEAVGHFGAIDGGGQTVSSGPERRAKSD